MQRKLHLTWSATAVTGLLVTPGLPRQAWLLQAAVVLNFFGNGLVAPYLVIYLHFERGIPLSLAALAIGSGGILATISGLVVGPVVDRFGPRTCVALAMIANAIAYGAYTQVHAPCQAFLVGMVVDASAEGPMGRLSQLNTGVDKPPRGFEPRTNGLQNHCSTTELRRLASANLVYCLSGRRQAGRGATRSRPSCAPARAR